MHNIKELQRQFEQAEGRLESAKQAYRDAHKCLMDAVCAEKLREFEAMGGIIGVTKVRVSQWFIGGENKPDMTRGPFVVTGAAPNPYARNPKAVFTVAKIKKDGTPSNAPTGVSPQHVHIVPEDQK